MLLVDRWRPRAARREGAGCDRRGSTLAGAHGPVRRRPSRSTTSTSTVARRRGRRRPRPERQRQVDAPARHRRAPAARRRHAWPSTASTATATPPHRRGVGLMFQDHALFPHLDVGANVAFGLRMQGQRGATRGRAGARSCSTSSACRASRTATIQTLSGGEQQRVALARALAPDAARPAARRAARRARPAAARAARRRAARRCSRRLDLTVVAVTHDQREAFALADRLVVIDARPRPPDRCPRRGVGRRRRARAVAAAARVHQPRRRRASRTAGCRTAVGRPRVRPPGRSAAVLVRPEAVRPDAGGPLEGTVVARHLRRRPHAGSGSRSPARRTSTPTSRAAGSRPRRRGRGAAPDRPRRPCGRCRADGPGVATGRSGDRRAAPTMPPGSAPVCALRCRPPPPCSVAPPRRSRSSRSWPAWPCRVAPALAQDDGGADHDHRATTTTTEPTTSPSRRSARPPPRRPPDPERSRWRRGAPRGAGAGGARHGAAARAGEPASTPQQAGRIVRQQLHVAEAEAVELETTYKQAKDRVVDARGRARRRWRRSITGLADDERAAVRRVEAARRQFEARDRVGRRARRSPSDVSALDRHRRPERPRHRADAPRLGARRRRPGGAASTSPPRREVSADLVGVAERLVDARLELEDARAAARRGAPGERGRAVQPRRVRGRVRDRDPRVRVPGRRPAQLRRLASARRG